MARHYDKIISLRLTQGEHEQLEELAEITGLSVGAFLRKRGLGHKITAKSDLQIIRELRRLGGLLKHLCLDGRVAQKEKEAVLTEIRYAIERISHDREEDTLKGDE